MKQLACIALVLFAAACGHHDKTCSSFQAAHVEMLRVDDGSPTMQRLYQHVVADKGSEITAAIDTWRPESAASTHTDYYLEGPSKPAIEKYVASLSPELAIPSSEKLVYEHVQPPTGSPYWRTYLVGARVLLDQTSIANVHASTSESLPTVTIDFTKAGSETFAKVTESAPRRATPPSS